MRGRANMGRGSSSRETAEAMGFVGPLDPELGALFNRVIETLVRLVAPAR